MARQESQYNRACAEKDVTETSRNSRYLSTAASANSYESEGYHYGDAPYAEDRYTPSCEYCESRTYNCVPDSPRKRALETMALNVSDDRSIATEVARQTYYTQGNEDYAMVTPTYDDEYYRQHLSQYPNPLNRLIELSAPPLTPEFAYHERSIDRCDPVEFALRGNDRPVSKWTYSQPTLKKPAPPTKTIEISPGMHLRLRGANETWEAVQLDFYIPCLCICCENKTIFCIEDADYVVCPSCKTVSPLERRNGTQEGGVGLGFTMETLGQIQKEITRSRVASLP